jgi:hypothetical protein
MSPLRRTSSTGRVSDSPSPPPSPPAVSPEASSATQLQTAWRRKQATAKRASLRAEVEDARLQHNAIVRLQMRLRQKRAWHVVSAALEERRQSNAAMRVQNVWRYRTHRLSRGDRTAQSVEDREGTLPTRAASGATVLLSGSTIVVGSRTDDVADDVVRSFHIGLPCSADEAAAAEKVLAAAWRISSSSMPSEAVVPTVRSSAKAPDPLQRFPTRSKSVRFCAQSSARVHPLPGDAVPTWDSPRLEASMAAQPVTAHRSRQSCDGVDDDRSSSSCTQTASGLSARGDSLSTLRKLHSWRRRRLMASRWTAAKPPPYHSLPQALLWPNPEVSLMIIFACALVEAASAILGAVSGGYAIGPTYVAMACIALTLVFVFDAFQMRQLAHFWRAHMSLCWTYQDCPNSRSEVDDPLLALLCRLRLIRPRCREQGAFLLPEEEAAEPQRTELALAEAFSCGMGFRQRIARFLFNRNLGHYARYDGNPGHSCERLQSFLSNGVATRMGILFDVVQVAIQLTIAIQTGFVFSAPSNSTQFTLLSTNLACQLLGAIFTAAGTANDLWNGLAVASVFALEGSASCCLLWSMALLQQGSGPDDFSVNATPHNSTGLDDSLHLLRVARAVQLAAVSTDLLTAAIFVPLCLIVYDSMLVPVVKLIWRVDAGSPLELLLSLLTAMVVVPMMLIRHFSFGGVDARVVADVADAADQFGGSMAEITTCAAGSSEVCDEAPTCSQGQPTTNK